MEDLPREWLHPLGWDPELYQKEDVMDLPLPVVGGLLAIFPGLDDVTLFFGLLGLDDVKLYPCLHLCLASPWAPSFSGPVSSSETP